MEYRIETDSLGEVSVPADKLWGAQTQRSIENFKIGIEKMPDEIIRAFALIKKAAASTNCELGHLDKKLAAAITEACDELLEGKLDGNFPLLVWQTGSGTQTNMNINEVVANRADAILGEAAIHPNNHVNMSQSSNDTFPTAMHIAAVTELEDLVLPAIAALKETFALKMKEYEHLIKTGRTHLQDATPLTLGQEISGWHMMLEKSEKMIRSSMEELRELALGGTAVGTGLNCPPGFAKRAAEKICELSGKEFVSAENKFHSLTARDSLVFAHGALKALAADMMKIANDVRLLASGPRCGIGELIIPENEPGSSIMPGKVNPTQAEAVTMVACRVMGNDMTVAMAASQGNLELNVFMPVIIYSFLQSTRLLGDCVNSFNEHCAAGIQANHERIKHNLDNSLMLVTALNPHIGYENAAKIAKLAYKDGLTLKEAAVKSRILTENEFDRYVRPEKMV
ncbi:class II fumarate hydratase [Bacillota bacterium]